MGGRLRDIFTDALGGGRVGGVIHRDRLTLALAKMGISQTHEEQMKGLRASTAVARMGRGGGAGVNEAWSVERKVERNKRQPTSEFVTYMVRL